jgi:ribosomal protein S18 acetylase RimI-like enzyme
MTAELVVRRNRPIDREAVIALHLTGRQDHPGHLISPDEDDLLTIEDVYLKAGEFLVGLEAGRVVAMGAIRPTEPSGTAEVVRVRVAEGSRRKGYARKIMADIEARARELGYRRLHLDTGVDMGPAQSLYKSLGYTELGPGLNGSYQVVFYEKLIEPR